MYLTASTSPAELAPQVHGVWQDDRVFIAWIGTVFGHGQRAGTETAAALGRALAARPLARACADLHGVYGLFVFDKSRARWQVLVDNAGLYHAFADETRVGTSFLELARARGCTAGDLSLPAVAEFLAEGAVYWNRTFCDAITSIGYDEIVELTPAATGQVGGLRRTRKEMPAPGSADEATFLGYFAALRAALEGRRVSVDLTGGVDSRLLVCLLAVQGLEFEAAVSGRPEIPDVRLAKSVAERLERPFHLTRHELAGLEEDLRDVFFETDGMADLLAHHRPWQLQTERRARGVEVAISGTGGALYKDTWWWQDFPRYARPRTDFARLYDMRIAPLPLPAHCLSAPLAEAYGGLRARTLARFETLRAATNSESYDHVFFHYRSRTVFGRYLTSHTNHRVAVVAPLLDYPNVLFACSLPRWERFFHRFQRRLLSAHCPALARLPTTEGTSVAAGRLALGRDLAGYTRDKARRLGIKLGQRWARRDLPPPGANAPDLNARVRASTLFEAALAALRTHGLVHGALSAARVRDDLLGRLLALGLLVRHLDAGPAPARPERSAQCW